MKEGPDNPADHAARLEGRIETLEQELVVLKRISDGAIQARDYHNEWSRKYRMAINEALTVDEKDRPNFALSWTRDILKAAIK